MAGDLGAHVGAANPEGPPQPIEATVLTILGAMREATLYVALAEDHEQARKDAGAVINRLIQALSAT
ncbi:MAG TPA: hypothetical protein VE400_25520 [Mycobacterium sp.]|nr:hypothetical protein [Mycobacterium sp.]